MRSRLALVLGLGLAGCVVGPAQTTPERIVLSPAGHYVFTTTAPPPPGCAYLGEVFGKFASADLQEAVSGAQIDLRNNAGVRGASMVVIETNNSVVLRTGRVEVVLGGKSLRCSAPAPAPAPTPAPAPALPPFPSPGVPSPAPSGR